MDYEKINDKFKKFKLKQSSDSMKKLCLPKKRNVKGFPYKPIRATSVDMFPQSNHCEIVMQLEHDFSGLKK